MTRHIFFRILDLVGTFERSFFDFPNGFHNTLEKPKTRETDNATLAVSLCFYYSIRRFLPEYCFYQKKTRYLFCSLEYRATYGESHFLIPLVVFLIIKKNKKIEFLMLNNYG